MTNIYIQGQLIDQFDDESIEVVSQVQDISDISKIKGDFSKTFTVPASKTNNRIFKHWYNASIEGGFDSRIKVDGKIDIHGIPFKSGKFLLRSAKIEDGIITSYTLNFFGNVTSLKDVIGEDELTDLDFSAYDHDYTDDDVINKLKVNYTDTHPAVIYTTLSKRRYYFQPDMSVEDDGEMESYAKEVLKQEESNSHNIAYPAAGIVNDDGEDIPDNKAKGIEWTDLHPSLRVDTVISAIENKYNITFTRDFFGTSEFNQLYMLLSSDKDIPRVKLNDSPLNFFGNGFYNGNTEFSDIRAYTGGPIIVDTNNNEFSFSLGDGDRFSTRIHAQRHSIIGTSNITVKLERSIDGGDYKVIQESEGISSKGGAGVGDVKFKVDHFVHRNNTGSTQNLKFRYKVTTDGSAEVYTQVRWGMSVPAGQGNQENGTFSMDNDVYSEAVVSGDELEIGLNLPKIKIMEWLKGIFQMFKLVVIPQEDGSLYVNTLNSYYTQGSEYDISKYVDRKSLEVNRGELFSSINMRFAESETILSEEFLRRNKRGYGEARIKLQDDNGEAIEGVDLDIELPFEQVVFERLTDLYTGEFSYIQTAHLVDRELNPTPVGVVLHYANFKSLYTDPNAVNREIKSLMVITNKSGTDKYEEINDTIYIPSHHPSLQDPYTSLLFREEFSTWDGALLNNTLYTNHYDNYVSAAFDVGRRTYKYRAKLPVLTTANLELNDVLIVDGVRYRINKYSYNMLTDISNLELINKLDTSLEPFNGAPPFLTVDGSGETVSFNLPFADEYTFTEVDLGDGTDWTSISTSFQNERGVERHNTVSITIDSNSVRGVSGAPEPDTGSFRRVKINFTLNSTTTSMIIVQTDEQ